MSDELFNKLVETIDGHYSHENIFRITEVLNALISAGSMLIAGIEDDASRAEMIKCFETNLNALIEERRKTGEFVHLEPVRSSSETLQ